MKHAFEIAAAKAGLRLPPMEPRSCGACARNVDGRCILFDDSAGETCSGFVALDRRTA